MEKQIILLTDFGLKDPYVGMMKGVIGKISKKTKVIDLTHFIEPQNIKQAAFVLSTAFEYFSHGSIFVVVVDPGVGSERKPIAIETEHYYFIGPDNGVFSYALQQQRLFVNAVDLNNKQLHLKKRSHTFHGRDIFAPSAAYIANNIPLKNLGTLMDTNDLLMLPDLKYDELKTRIKAEIVHFDNYGNIITSIPNNKLKNKRIKQVKIADTDIKGLSKTFVDVEKGELVAYPGSAGYMEIAVRNGNARNMLKATDEMEITVTF
jgi:S-adenosylmethionine hydrolase